MAETKASEYLNTIHNPVLWYTSVSVPLGKHIALLDETLAEDNCFPFRITELIGTVEEDGTFTVETDGLTDGNANSIWRLQIFENRMIFKAQEKEFYED